MLKQSWIDIEDDIGIRVFYHRLNEVLKWLCSSSKYKYEMVMSLVLVGLFYYESAF